MEYNTQREQLKISDYGRNVVKMIDYAKRLDDREERNKMANVIIDVMAQLNPKIKERTDYKHILWDHLMMMANYDLDVDCPYDITREESENIHPHRLALHNLGIRYRHYGHLTEAFMKELKEMPDSPERTRLTEMIANYMKRSLYNWNRDAMDERKVAADIDNYTEGNVNLPEGMRFASVSNGHLPGSNASKKKRRK